MGVYTRFKRSPDGLRQLVELWESTPIERRQRMIDVGMEEDAAYTHKVLEYVMTFEDVLTFNDLELAELLANAIPRIMAFALHRQPEEVVQRFLRNAKPPVAAEIKDQIQVKIGLREIGGAQLKIVEEARKLERKGLIQVKRIPLDG